VKIREEPTTVRSLVVTDKNVLRATVLTSEEAIDIALEYGFNPVVDDEKSFDILPE
jgi:translation initiation factor IF-2